MRNAVLVLLLVFGTLFGIAKLVERVEFNARIAKSAPPPVTATFTSPEPPAKSLEEGQPASESVVNPDPVVSAQTGKEPEPQPVVEPRRATPKPEPWITIDKSRSMQKERRDLLTKLDGLKVIKAPSKPRADTVHVSVRDRFMALSFEEKDRFMGVLYAYAFDGTSLTDRVVLFDYYTGKEVGQYTLTVPGLEMY
jgi:hypothetical protein